MLEEYNCDTGNYSNEDIYNMIEDCYEDYCDYGIAHFEDLTTGYTLTTIDEYINNNDDYVGTYVYMNGTVVSSSGNIVEIVDHLTVAEKWQNEILGYVFSGIGALQYGADISLLDNVNADDFTAGDNVEVVGMYCGKIRLKDGSYTPAIIAVDIYQYSPIIINY